MPKLTHSLKYQERAKRLIPGMGQLLSKRPDMFSLGVWPGYYSKAKGAEIWDLDGTRYVDMSIGGIGANVLGYADRDVDAAVKKAISHGSSCSLNCPEEVDLSEKLCAMHQWASKVRLARSGGEAMAVAVRIARAYTGRDKVVICGYHGWHDWYLAANLGTENALGEHLIQGLSPVGVPRALKGTALTFRYNDIESLKDVAVRYKNELAAIIMEPIRNSEPAPGFLSSVRAIAHQINAVFIFDEISSGFRLNAGGAHLRFQVVPEMAVFSKCLGNGYPIAAIIGTSDVMEAAQKTFISSTMWTERVGPAAALAMIRKYEKYDVASRLMSLGKRIQEGWQSAAQAAGLKIHVSGIYPLSHFSFEDPEHAAMKAFLVQELVEKRILASNLFYSMFAHTDKHVNNYLDAVGDVFLRLSRLKTSGRLQTALRGQPASAGFKRLT